MFSIQFRHLNPTFSLSKLTEIDPGQKQKQPLSSKAKLNNPISQPTSA